MSCCQRKRIFFENNRGIKLMGCNHLSSHKQSTFKYFSKYDFIRKISSKTLRLFWVINRLKVVPFHCKDCLRIILGH